MLNDTVGTLMACAFKDNRCQIGVIVGTGTNACYMEKISNCNKLAGENFENDGFPDEVTFCKDFGLLNFLVFAYSFRVFLQLITSELVLLERFPTLKNLEMAERGRGRGNMK